MAALHRGEVVISRAIARDGSSSEIEIDGGMINHWRGTAFVPKVSMDVLSSRVVSTGEGSQKLYLRLRRTKFVTVVYDTEYDTNYRRLSPNRALSNSISTKIVEIESLTLSRNLPPIIGVLIRPIVTGTARESITRTLASMRARFAG